MNYATTLEFEQSPDFGYLKHLVLEAANDNGLDIFDNIFDWSVKFTQIRKKKYMGSKLIEDSESPLFAAGNQLKMPKQGTKEYLLAKSQRFRNYDDVRKMKMLAYQSRRENWLAKLNKQEEQKKEEAAKDKNEGKHFMSGVPNKGKSVIHYHLKAIFTTYYNAKRRSN